MSAPSSPVKSPASPEQSASKAAADAALARVGRSASLSRQDQEAIRKEKLKLLKIIDDHIVASLPKKDQALMALDTLHTLLTNALTGDEAKLTIRLSNPALQKRFSGAEQLRTDGGIIAYLHESGFRHNVQNFEAKRTFSASPTVDQRAQLILAAEVLGDRRDALKKAWAGATKGAEAEKAAEASRAEQTLLKIQDDRESVRLRAQRESDARARRAKAAAGVEAAEARRGEKKE